ncbi:hypothetical protein BJ912DRAFT_151972 [Pholiota molesta]|nr:hypothetical protein BJ912DRAFT_151972 [Pholiota molesta]
MYSILVHSSSSARRCARDCQRHALVRVPPIHCPIVAQRQWVASLHRCAAKVRQRCVLTDCGLPGRRLPSPKGMLSSFAFAADDEIVSTAWQWRVVPIGGAPGIGGGARQCRAGRQRACTQWGSRLGCRARAVDLSECHPRRVFPSSPGGHCTEDVPPAPGRATGEVPLPIHVLVNIQTTTKTRTHL